jgi:hypothetical protein
MKSMHKLYPAILTAALLCPSPMFVTPANSAEKTPCSEDISKFCQDFPPGKAAIANCLELHEKELSAACREYRSKMTGRREEIRAEMAARVRFRQACRDDMAKFCRDVKPDLEAVVQCLDGHENELTGPCAEEIRQRGKVAKGAKDKKMGE